MADLSDVLANLRLPDPRPATLDEGLEAMSTALGVALDELGYTKGVIAHEDYYCSYSSLGEVARICAIVLRDALSCQREVQQMRAAQYQRGEGPAYAERHESVASPPPPPRD